MISIGRAWHSCREHDKKWHTHQGEGLRCGAQSRVLKWDEGGRKLLTSKYKQTVKSTSRAGKQEPRRHNPTTGTTARGSQRGSICAACAPRATFTAGYQEWVGFYPITKCPLRRANPWVQDLCKHPSVLPYPSPPKVKIHKMAPWEQPPPYFGVSLLDCRLPK